MKTIPPAHALDIDDEEEPYEQIVRTPATEELTPIPSRLPSPSTGRSDTPPSERLEYVDAFGNPYRHPAVTRDEMVVTRHQARMRKEFGLDETDSTDDQSHNAPGENPSHAYGTKDPCAYRRPHFLTEFGASESYVIPPGRKAHCLC